MGRPPLIPPAVALAIAKRFPPTLPQRARSLRLPVEILALRFCWGRAIAFALLSASLSLLFFVIPEFERRGQSVRQEISQAPVEKAEVSTRSVENERHADFRAALAHSDARDDVLKTLFTEAEAAGIKLAQGEHEWQRDEDGDYQRMRLNLPLTGSAKQIRQFVYAILAGLPNASLDHISLRRDNVRNSIIEAKVQLTIYFKDAN